MHRTSRRLRFRPGAGATATSESLRRPPTIARIGGPWRALALSAVVFAGCGASNGSAEGSAAPGGSVGLGQPSGSPTSPVASSSPPVDAPSASSSGATAAPGGSASAAPSLEGAAELEALLPTEVAGARLARFSMSGADFASRSGQLGPGFVAFLDRLGRTPEDVSVAVAVDETGALEAQIAAIRVAGADPNLLVDAYAAGQQVDGEATIEAGTRNVGGRDVTVLTESGDAPSPPTYLLPVGDVLFVVQAAREDVAADALAALP